MSFFIKSLILAVATLRSVNALPEILGGTTIANPDAYPFIANIFYNGEQWCTGTRIAENFIITAAHCKLDSPGSGAIVFANTGTKDTRVLPENNNEIIYNVVNQVVNPRYIRNEVNDIMLIEIQPKDPSKTVPYNPDAVTLDDGSHSQEGKGRLAIGYGDINDSRVKTTQLQEVTLTIANFQTCKDLWSGASKVFDTQLCAGASTKNVCRGDSGGPLLEQDSPSHVFLLATVSFGTNCDKSNTPSIYTKVSSYLDWINSVLKQYPPNDINTTTTTTTVASTTSTTTTTSSSSYGPTSTYSTTGSTSITSSSTTSSSFKYTESSTSSTTSSNVYPQSSTTTTSSSGYDQLPSSTSTKPLKAYNTKTAATTTTVEPYMVTATSTTTTSSSAGYSTTFTTTTGGGGYATPTSSVPNPEPTEIQPPKPAKCGV